MLQAVKGCKVGVFSTAEKRVPNYCHNCHNREAVHANKFDPYYSLSLSLSVSTSTSTSISLLMFHSPILFSSLPLSTDLFHFSHLSPTMQSHLYEEQSIIVVYRGFVTENKIALKTKKLQEKTVSKIIKIVNRAVLRKKFTK